MTMVTRFLSASYLYSTTIENRAKPLVRCCEDSEDTVFIGDDTIIGKSYKDRDALIRCHFDPSKGRTLKVASLLSLLFDATGVFAGIPFSALLWDTNKARASIAGCSSLVLR